jgi:hypothetical protein
MLRRRVGQLRLRVMTSTGVDFPRADSKRCLDVRCKAEPVALRL